MTYYNAMNGGIDPSMLPEYVPQAYQVLQDSGYDLRQLFPDGFPGQQQPTYGGGAQGNPPGVLSMAGQPGQTPEEMMKRLLGPIPGATGWDGVNQKLQWMKQRQQMARLMNPSLQKTPLTGPGSDAGMRRDFTHEGVHAGAGMGGPRGGGLFARLGHMLGVMP